MRYISLLVFLFSQSVVAGGEWGEFRRILTEENLESHIFLYKRDDSSFCFLNLNIYQTVDGSTKLVESLNEISSPCDFSEEEVIQTLVQNTDISESNIESLTKQGVAYLSASGEIGPVHEFQPAMAGLPILAGRVLLAMVPVGSVVILSIQRVAGITDLDLDPPETILEKIQRTITAVRLLLMLNRELSMLRPLQSLGRDMGDWPEGRENRIWELYPVDELNNPETLPTPPVVEDRKEWIEGLLALHEADKQRIEEWRRRQKEMQERRREEIIRRSQEAQAKREERQDSENQSDEELQDRSERVNFWEREEMEEAEWREWEEAERMSEDYQEKFRLWKESLEQAMGVELTDEEAMSLLNELEVEEFLAVYKMGKDFYEQKLGRELTDQEDRWLLQAKKNLLDRDYLQYLQDGFKGHLN